MFSVSLWHSLFLLCFIEQLTGNDLAVLVKQLNTVEWGKSDNDSLPDVGQKLEEVIRGDFAAVLAIERRKFAVHVQTPLSVFEHLPGSDQTGSRFKKQTDSLIQTRNVMILQKTRTFLQKGNTRK